MRAAYDGISGVPGLDDRHQLAFEALTFETRYRLLDRTHAPFGLTLGLDPHWGFIDDISGAPVDQYGAQFLVAADKELVEKRIFGAVNLIYEPDAIRSRVTGAWEHQSDVGISAGLTAQAASGIFVGRRRPAILRHSYDGLALDAFAGNARPAGPTFYWKISELYWMSAAWSIQVAGRAADGTGSLDLTNFERHQAVLRFCQFLDQPRYSPPIAGPGSSGTPPLDGQLEAAARDRPGSTSRRRAPAAGRR